MLIVKEQINKLREFGLNTYESKIWTALLSRGVSTAGELSDIANVPRSRSYDVLESLEKKGFVIMKLGKPIKYIAVPPKDALKNIKEKISKETKKQILEIESLKLSKIINELAQMHLHGMESQNQMEISGMLKGNKNIHNHLEFMLKNSINTAYLLITKKDFDEKREMLKKIFTQNKKPKVKIAVSRKKKDEITEGMQGTEVKQTKINSRFCIVDGKEILFMLHDSQEVHPDYDVGVWVNNKIIAEFLKNLFENEWKNMETVK